MKPSIGRMVHYVLENGQHRAATITNAFGGPVANLTVHLDGLNDVEPPYATAGGLTGLNPRAGLLKAGLLPPGAGGGNGFPLVLVVGSAPQDEERKRPGTWHWPERE